MRKKCSNCYWYSVCDHTERCEYYEPIATVDKRILREYKLSLTERAKNYREIVNELDD